jgi:hypothetical protein
MKYSNCYPNCGGEDCVCCEIHVDNQREVANSNFSELDQFDDYEEDEDYE